MSMSLLGTDDQQAAQSPPKKGNLFSTRRRQRRQTTTMNTTGDDDNRNVMIAQLQQWNQEWCKTASLLLLLAEQQETKDTTRSTSGVASSDRETPQTPLSMALNLVATTIVSSLETESTSSRIIIQQHLFKTLHSTFERQRQTNVISTATTATTITTKSDGFAAGETTAATDVVSNRKIKQIEWHVTLLLELWMKGGDAMMETCAKCLQEQNPDRNKSSSSSSSKKQQRSKRQRRNFQNKKKTSSSSKTIILNHLVETISRAPYLLPFGTPLQQFLASIVTQKHWEALPAVVSHLYGAFEIPNPFLLESSEDDESVDYDLFSASNNAPPQEHTDEPQPSKRRKAPPQQEQQQKKQRVLSTLNKNRLLTKSSSRTTHFQGKMNDISKLLDKTPSGAATAASLDRKRKNANAASIITPHPSTTGKLVKKRIGGGEQLEQITKKNPSNMKRNVVTIQESSQNIVETLTPPPPPPPGFALKRATTLPDLSSSSQQIALPLSDAVVGETPVKSGNPRNDACLERVLVVGETPCIPRSRPLKGGTLLATTTNNNNNNTALQDLQATNSNNMPTNVENAKPVQPVKLFGAIRPHRPKEDAAATKQDKKTNSISSGKSIQLARKLLRRRSV
jgi:hypothetical protein